MRQVIFLFSVMVSLTGSTQIFQNHALYLSGGNNVTTDSYSGISVSFQYVYKEKFALKYGSSSNTRVSATFPKDYQGGLFSFGKPKESLSFEYVALGRVVKLKGSHKVRLNLAAGIAQIKEKTITKWLYTPGGIFGANYSPETNLVESTGIILNPSLELTVGRGIGLSISPYAVFSNKLQSVGCSFNVMLGLLRGKYKSK